MKKKAGRIRNNQSGQMAVFVALIFQVLFVLFAMSINVALIVHDKINLQNSVDLAAYYVAQRQAEYLNAIAHQNYAIRQSWKLLTWRYRVVGTMGLDIRNTPAGPHPARPRGNRGPLRTEEQWPSAGFDPPPSICVTHEATWPEVGTDQNLCNARNLRIPELPRVPVIADFIGINQTIAQMADNLRAQYDDECNRHGAYNWFYTAAILLAFREDQWNRKAVIYTLANALKGGAEGDFLDFDGNSVLEGATQTLNRNLTYTNRFSAPNIELYNSLKDVTLPQQWLVPVLVAPYLRYVDVTQEGGCNARDRNMEELPTRQTARNIIANQLDPTGNLRAWTQNLIFEGNPLSRYSVGVEKNPWIQVYAGIRASTRPRQLFFPIGPNVTMTARAFAKPFGGRIGPWSGDRWPKSAAYSIGEMLDPLLPVRVPPDTMSFDSSRSASRFPNYSRFLGDPFGLSSNLALSHINGLFGNQFKLFYNYYRKSFVGGRNGMQVGTESDPVIWDYRTGTAPEARAFELAAIQPDLFDITYYSIIPNFSENYLGRLQANRNVLGFDSNVPIRGDLGEHPPVVPTSNVQSQITQSLPAFANEAWYFVRDPNHLLTAWMPGQGVFNYPVNPANFGNCQIRDDEFDIKTPNSCPVGGGRAGYSVKIISRDALFNAQARIGGATEAPDTILNPPNEPGW